MSDRGDDGNLDLRYGSNSSLQDSGNYDSIMGEPNIIPNSQFDRSISFDSDDDEPPPISKRPTAPKSRYDIDYDDPPMGDNAYSIPTPPRLNSPDEVAGSSPELSSLFSLIANFQPNPVEMTVHWKPFLPDLVPAIGSIDAFIKVPRPDSDLDELGLVYLDEPSIAQSNPQVLKMELREKYNLSSPENQGDAYIGCIEDPQKNSKALNSWLESIEEIHRNRPPPIVIYSSKMPELEELMEVWPPKFEDTLKSLPLPTADIDLSVSDFAKMTCALLEIPVKSNIIESLHHLFSLYAQFEGNQYFQSVRTSTPLK